MAHQQPEPLRINERQPEPPSQLRDDRRAGLAVVPRSAFPEIVEQGRKQQQVRPRHPP